MYNIYSIIDYIYSITYYISSVYICMCVSVSICIYLMYDVQRVSAHQPVFDIID